MLADRKPHTAEDERHYAALIAAAPEMLRWLVNHATHPHWCAVHKAGKCTCGLDSIIAKAEGRI